MDPAGTVIEPGAGPCKEDATLKQPTRTMLTGLGCAAVFVLAGASHLMGQEMKRVMRTIEDPPRVEMKSARADLPLLMYGGRPIVELSINGAGAHRFILDTGARMTVVDAGLAKELGLPETGSMRLGSPAGGEPDEVPTVAMGEVRMGEIVIHDIGAAVMELAEFFRDPEGPRGVLSAHLFSGLLLTIDYPGERLSVSAGELPPSDEKRVFQYGEEDGHPTVGLMIAGEAIPAHLDTGSPATFTLPGRYMETLPLASPAVPRGKARLVDAEITLYEASLDGNVIVGEYAYEKPRTVFADGFPAGNIGHGFLKEYSVTLDFANLRVKLDRGGEPGADTPPASGAHLVGGQESPGMAWTDEPAAPGQVNGPIVVKKAGDTEGSPGQGWSQQGTPVSHVAGAAGGQRKRYGVFFPGIAGESLEVMGCEPGSPAEKAGLLAGDRVVAMNGTPLAELDEAARMERLRAPTITLTIERDGASKEIRMRLE